MGPTSIAQRPAQRRDFSLDGRGRGHRHYRSFLASGAAGVRGRGKAGASAHWRLNPVR